MSIALQISFLCYSVTAMLSILFGSIYLTRSKFMPYHAVALGKQWADLEQEFQILLLALMRVAGGGLLATGIGVILLLFAYLSAEARWTLVIIPTISLITSLSSFYATCLVSTRTPGSPPMTLTLFSIGLILAGLILSFI